MTAHVLCISWLVALAAGAARGEVVTIQVPLEDGRLQVRQVIESMLREAGLDPGERLQGIDWTIDLGSAAGRLQLAIFDRLAPGTVTTQVRPDAVVVSFDRRALQKNVDRMVRGVQQWLAGNAADAAGGPRYGLTVVTRDDPRAPLATLAEETRRAVVLVHGLDDPGWMWRDMTPHLLDDGHVVLRFEYPNDQAIADSADLLATDLEALRTRGVAQVDIVAHSMGGLVARDVLTRSAYYGGDGSGGGRYPAVRRLLMLGTPNHGSPMARLRGLSELREQVSRSMSGSGTQAEAFRDGAGEAGRDLLPDSDFLRRLNARPNPSYTTLTVVAGRISPISAQDIERLSPLLERIERAAGPREPGAVARWMNSAVSGLGDGLVSIDSARLEGVPDTVIVKANHESMIVNLLASESVPPAIPIVLKRLAEEP